MALRKIREYMIFIGLLMLGSGLYFTITSGYWVLQRSEFIEKNYSLEQLTAWAGNWNWWLLTLGVILISVGGWLTYDTFKKKSEFEEYINTDSKKKFVQNLRDLEEIAYKLGPKYEERLAEKKREWRIKH